MSTYRVVRVWVSAAFVAAAVALAWPGSPLVRAQAPYDSSLYSGLRWRMLGPFRGGRVDAVSGVPGRPNEFYFGAVNGGVWKTIDAGRVWTPVFDSQPVASIGALAVAPSAPDTVYVGTGESTLRDSMGYGNGMYKSTDAGKTWTHIGLDDTQHIGKIAVDPEERRTSSSSRRSAISTKRTRTAASSARRTAARPGRKCCSRTTASARSTSSIDPTNSHIVYASLWNTRRPPWYTYQPTNGPGGGLFKSTDGGTTWKQLTNGLPTDCVGKTGIAVAPSNPRRVYAVVDDFLPEGAAADTPCPGAPPGRGAGAGAAGAAGAGRGRGAGAAAGAAAPPAAQGGFFRSDDAGATWTKLSGDTALWGRGWYFEHVAVDPKNADIVYVPNVALSRSKDGGKTWVPLRGSPGGDDYHQPWISPDDPEHDDLRERSGHGHHAQRHGRRSTRRDLELVAESADRADLSPLRGLPVPVLGDRRAAGQRRGRGALARQVRGHLDARLGADRRRAARAA